MNKRKFLDYFIHILISLSGVALFVLITCMIYLLLNHDSSFDKYNLLFVSLIIVGSILNIVWFTFYYLRHVSDNQRSIKEKEVAFKFISDIWLLQHQEKLSKQEQQLKKDKVFWESTQKIIENLKKEIKDESIETNECTSPENKWTVSKALTKVSIDDDALKNIESILMQFRNGLQVESKEE